MRATWLAISYSERQQNEDDIKSSKQIWSKQYKTKSLKFCLSSQLHPSHKTYIIKQVRGPVRRTPLRHEPGEGHAVQHLHEEIILR